MALILLLGIYSWGQPQTLSSENLIEMARQAYQQGPGAATQKEAEGLAWAAEQTGPRVEGYSLNLLPEVSTSGKGCGEHSLQLEAEIPLANLPRHRQAQLLTRAESTRQGARLEQLEWTLRLQTLYSEAMLADELLGHVRELHERAAQEEQRLAEQMEKQLATKTDWLAQKTLSGEYAHEAREMEARYAEAQLQIARMLGGPVQLAFPAFDDLPDDADNPFSAMTELADPSATYAQARATQAEASARLALAQRATSLSPNMHYRDEPGGDSWLGLGLKLSFKTGPRHNAAWRESKTEADAWQLRAKWAATTRRAQWKTREEQYSRKRRQLQAWKEEVLAPLEQQLALSQSALAAGLLERRFYLEADRGLHEAEHTYLEMLADLWTERMEAGVWQHLQGAKEETK